MSRAVRIPGCAQSQRSRLSFHILGGDGPLPYLLRRASKPHPKTCTPPPGQRSACPEERRSSDSRRPGPVPSPSSPEDTELRTNTVAPFRNQHPNPAIARSNIRSPRRWLCRRSTSSSSSSPVRTLRVMISARCAEYHAPGCSDVLFLRFLIAEPIAMASPTTMAPIPASACCPQRR